ncbi:hypothetical protein SAMN05444274_103117 [Mariniphaga anaerophila]|uniref:GyrI-like small molecule binding domain-containing protein n=1 Tax=Mariniphaga anaerophila TaxID=1484053 RepID=A0A1M4XT45_9BACT|nr:hydrolase [Mariniphaga anaerophila]SHE96774.1 hypothetical protein SAMN05444274_103117 [Mariniphaga anaerophila]
MTQEKTETDICCPEFDPTPWNKKIFNWKNKKFIKDNVFTFFYMPVNFAKVLGRMNKKMEAAQTESPDWMCLAEHTSGWNMDIYLAVDKEIPDAQNLEMNGDFASKVYEGSFKEIGNWGKDFASWCEKNNYKPAKTYLWYTTCPKCAKKYGKNYVVYVAEIEKA